MYEELSLRDARPAYPSARCPLSSRSFCSCNWVNEDEPRGEDGDGSSRSLHALRSNVIPNRRDFKLSRGAPALAQERVSRATIIVESESCKIALKCRLSRGRTVLGNNARESYTPGQWRETTQVETGAREREKRRRCPRRVRVSSLAASSSIIVGLGDLRLDQRK